MEAWSTQRLQDAIDALNMDVDGEYVDLAIHAAIAADDAMAEGGGG